MVLEPGSGLNFRLDVLSALASPENQEPGSPKPGGPTVPWTRKFVARDISGLVTFRGVWSHSGPVPFRRHPVQGQVGDDLAVALLQPEFLPRGQRGPIGRTAGAPSGERPGPGGGNGAPPPRPGQHPARPTGPCGHRCLSRARGRPGRLGRDSGRRKRTRPGGGFRGLLWVAPSLGFAVVRSEATQDPSQVGMPHGRTDLAEVGRRLRRGRRPLAPPQGRDPVHRGPTSDDLCPHAESELAAVIEDYRASPR